MAGSGKRIFQTKGKVLIKLLFENELKKNIKKKKNKQKSQAENYKRKLFCETGKTAAIGSSLSAK